MIPRLLAAAAALFLFAAASVVRAESPALPGDSVYRLDVPLLDQDAKLITFPSLRGKVRIASMFYSSCPYVCPMIVETIRRVEKQLDPAARARLEVALVSLDPERDDPPTLKKTAKERHVDETRWRLLRAESGDVRKIAAVLGVQYRQLENRDFNHSSALVLLDADGHVLARSSTIGEPDPEFVAAVKAALAH